MTNFEERAPYLNYENPFTAINALAKASSCKVPSFSPNGEKIAFLCNLTGVDQIWAVSAEGGWPRPITMLDDPVMKFSWSPQGNFLAFELAPGGSTRTQIYLVHPDGNGLCQLSEGQGETNWLGLWHPDGKRVSIASNCRNPAHFDTYLLDIQDGTYHCIAQNRGIGYLTDIHAQGKRALLYRMEDRTDSNLYLLDLNSGAERLLTPHERPGNAPKGLFAINPDTIYMITDGDDDYKALVRVRLNQAGKPETMDTLCKREHIELDNFELSPDGSIAVLCWNVSGKSELSLLTLDDGEEAQLAFDTPGNVVGKMTFSKRENRFAFDVCRADLPQNIFIIDFDKTKPRQATFSAHPGLNLGGLVAPRFVEFPAHDGTLLNAWFYLPHNFKQPGPVVINFHGGPEAQERPTFKPIYQALLAQGIAIFATNVRGSSGFGKTFQNLDNGSLRGNAIKDIRTCVERITKSGTANPDRVGIMGDSYGGYMSISGLTRFPNLFAAGVVISGFAKFETFFANTEPWIAQISKTVYGHPQNDREQLQNLSALDLITSSIPPTLILHGKNDTNVPVTEAEQMAQKIKEQGGSVKYILFPNEGHNFANVSTHVRVIHAIVDWFKDYLWG